MELNPAPLEQALKAAPSKQSRILTLPAELRNRILEFALIEDQPILLYLAQIVPTRIQAKPDIPGVVNSCRQLRGEGLPLYYGGNKFKRIQQPSTFPNLSRWLRMRESSASENIRRISFHFKGLFGATFGGAPSISSSQSLPTATWWCARASI